MTAERRLAVVVTTAPARGDLERAFALVRAARAGGCAVAMFFMADAVAGLPARRRELTELSAEGCDLACCAESAAAAGLGEDDVAMVLGSQDDHAALVHRAHRLVAFT